MKEIVCCEGLEEGLDCEIQVTYYVMFELF